MTTRILVALDHSTMSPQVFREALTLATALQADLILLHVLSRGAADSPNLPAMPIMDYYPDYNVSAMELFETAWKAYEEKGLNMLKQYESEANIVGVSTQVLQLEGSPGTVICEQAAEHNASVIVMGRRGHSGFGELLLGSVSNSVLHHAPCTVHILNASKQN